MDRAALQCLNVVRQWVKSPPWHIDDVRRVKMAVERVAPDGPSDDAVVVNPAFVVHAGNDVTFRLYSQAAWTVIEAVGEIDVAVAPAMREMLDRAPSSRVVFDLRRVSFMDASGLGVLAAAWRRATSMGGAVRLLSPDKGITRILEITHLDGVLPVYARLEEATA
jgi:anti-sigma B factor antagonist